MDKILRSKTGKYHLGVDSSSRCNGRSGKFGYPTAEQFARADDSSLCTKCFWDGKNTQGSEEEILKEQA